MQKETVTLTLDLTLNEALEVMSHLHSFRNQTLPAPMEKERPKDPPFTVPVSTVTAPDYRPPQAAYPQPAPTPAPAPAWQPPQPPLAAQPQPVNAPAMPPQWQQQAGAQPVPAVPTSAPTYSLEQLAIAAAPLMDAGRGAELTAMLATFGVVSLNQLPPERYPDFALNLRAMGASL